MSLISCFKTHDDIGLLLRFTERTLILLGNAKRKDTDVIHLNGIFEYVEQYRYDAFSWRNPHVQEGRFEREARKRTEATAKEAINNAATVVFPGQTRECVALTIQKVLHTLVGGIPSSDLNAAKQFFAQLKIELEQRK